MAGGQAPISHSIDSDRAGVAIANASVNVRFGDRWYSIKSSSPISHTKSLCVDIFFFLHNFWMQMPTFRKLAIAGLAILALGLVHVARADDDENANAIVIVEEPDIVTPEGFDPYAALGVATDASRAELKKGYKAALKGAEASKIDEIELAWKIVGNGDRKKKWDKSHGLAAGTEEL